MEEAHGTDGGAGVRAAADADPAQGDREFYSLAGLRDESDVEHDDDGDCDEPGGRTPIALIIGRFIRFWGAGLYYNRERWDTRDGVIPFRVFYVLMDAMDAVDAGEQLRDAMAHAHGQAIAENGKDSKVRSQTRRMMRRADPKM